MQSSSNEPFHISAKLKLIAVVVISGLAGLYVTSLLTEDSGSKYVGYLAAETTVVVGDRQGKIEQLHVSQGEEITPQKLIATVTDLDYSKHVTQIKTALKQNQAMIEQAEARIDVEVTWRTRSIETDLHRTQLESASFLKKQLDLKMDLLALNKLLPINHTESRIEQSAFIPLSQEEPKTEKERMNLLLKKEANRNAREVVDVQINICDERIERLNTLAKELPAKIERSHQLAFLKSEQHRFTQQLEQVDNQNTNVKIHSHAYGIIGILHKSAGDTVYAGEPIATLFDQQQRYLIVYVPSTEIDKFVSAQKEQAKLKLTFAGDMTHTGLIDSIPSHAEKMSPTGKTTSIRMVKVRVIPFGKPWSPLPIGSQVDVRLQ